MRTISSENFSLCSLLRLRLLFHSSALKAYFSTPVNSLGDIISTCFTPRISGIRVALYKVTQLYLYFRICYLSFSRIDESLHFLPGFLELLEALQF